ncbi:MAG: hypothetical protein M3417_11615 [Actinomycetota bacterium]|nr:hypothetical protein [Actinomycetota bacterium]
MSEEEVIREEIEAGASVARLAELLGLDPPAVRLRLEQLGLTTARQRVLRNARTARSAGATRIVLSCPFHGELEHRIDARGSYRCPECNKARVTRHRRTVKEILVTEAGGACALCGYDRCRRALSFHHVDPEQKSFGLALGGVSRSLDKAREEAKKCVLLCANCHMEVENGLRAIPLQ